MASEVAETIGIVGLGLIGGSIGLALREPGRTVVGFDVDPAAQQVARDRACVDRIAALEEVAKADLVFIAVPPDVIVPICEQVMAAAGPETVVTDCASVKGEVAEWAAAGKQARFVPGHPMAGHEKGGAQYASSWMFRGARWILTPVKATETASVRTVEAAVKWMGAKPVRIAPAQHDRHVAVVSHLPHALAAVLVLLSEELDQTEVAGGSWRDLTRVGGVDPDLWTQIMMRNRTELAKVLGDFGEGLDSLRRALESDDREALHAALAKAQSIKAGQGTGETTKTLKRGRR